MSSQVPDVARAAPTSATPILDSAVLPQSVRRKKLMGTVVGLVIGIGLSAWLASDYEHLESDHPVGLAITAIFVLPVVIHELGHLLAGWFVGFHFNVFGLGPFALKVEHGKLKAQLHTGMASLAYVAMQVGGVSRLRRRLLIYIGAGPAANLLSLPLTALLVNHIFPVWGHSWMAIPAGQFAAFSLLIGMVSFVPFGDGSDGQRISILLSSLGPARRMLSNFALGDQVRKGIRPKFWKRSWLNAATRLQDGSKDEFFGKWLAYISANDAKNATVAASYLERCLELAKGNGPAALDLTVTEAAVFTAWFRQDVPTAEKWLAQVKKPKEISRLSRIRVDTALLCARHEFDVALARWQEGLTYIDNLPVAPSNDTLREGWLEWQTEIQQRREQVAS